MNIACKTDSATIWRVSLWYLFFKELQIFVIVFALPLFALFQMLWGEVDLLGLFTLFVPALWLMRYLARVRRQAQLWIEISQRCLIFQIREDGFSLKTENIAVEGQWSVIKELLFFKNHFVVIPEKIFQTLIVPRTDPLFEDEVVSHVRKEGGRVLFAHKEHTAENSSSSFPCMQRSTYDKPAE